MKTRQQFIDALLLASRNLVIGGASPIVESNIPQAKIFADTAGIFIENPNKQGSEDPVIRAVIFFALYDTPKTTFLEQQSRMEEAWEYFDRRQIKEPVPLTLEIDSENRGYKYYEKKLQEFLLNEASRRFSTIVDRARWLGVSRETYYLWTRK